VDQQSSLSSMFHETAAALQGCELEGAEGEVKGA